MNRVLPIRKTSPNTVALTSFYGKNFIRRSEKVAQDRPKWLVNELVRRGIDLTDVSVTDLKFADVFDREAVTPRDYSSISMRLSGFTAGDTIFNFDYRKRNEIYSEAVVKHCEESKLVPIGLRSNAVVAMDQYNIVYQISDGKVEEQGTLPDLLGFDLTKEPKEFTEISMMGKDVPLAIVFGYYLGLRNALKGYKVPFEVYEPAQRITTTGNDIVIRFSDAKMVIAPQTPEQRLIFNGLMPYVKLMRDYTIRDMDKKDVYLNLIQKNGLTNRYLNELELMDTMFVDPITERILKKMGEPVTFKGLLKRANDLLTNDAHPRETDAFSQHIYNQQRIAGAVYTEMVRSVREYRNKPGTRKKLEMQQNAVWSMISQDPSVMPASNANPIQSIKEASVVTFGGEGGRSRRSMVKQTREYLESDVGLISESTVDSGDVAITSYLTDNPIFDDVDGLIKGTSKKELKLNQILSTTSMLAPGNEFDDPRRQNFCGIQHGSGIAADGYEVTGLRTGYEKIVAHRTSNQQTNIAEADGKVLAVSNDLLTIEYTGKDGVYTKSYKLGRYFGRHEGGIFPHDMSTKLKVGDSVKKSDVVAFNSKFFEPDTVNPSQVNWKAGIIAMTALIEGADTLEDSSAISPRLSRLLKTQITKEKIITVRFDQAVHGLVKPGDKVDPESILCTIEDSLTATSGAFTDKSLEHLQAISDQTPQAKVLGVIDQVEVFYNGELEDMSESVRQVAMYGDRLRKKAAAVNPERIALTGQVDSSLRIGGHPVELDTIVIRVYITQDVPAIGGDKGVFANQMKSTFRNVMIGKNTAEDGTPLDAYFGKKSVDERIVLSVFKIGTANTLCRLESERCQAILAAE